MTIQKASIRPWLDLRGRRLTALFDLMKSDRRSLFSISRPLFQVPVSTPWAYASGNPPTASARRAGQHEQVADDDEAEANKCRCGPLIAFEHGGDEQREDGKQNRGVARPRRADAAE